MASKDESDESVFQASRNALPVAGASTGMILNAPLASLRHCIFVMTITLLTAHSAIAQNVDYSVLSLTDLANIKITTASREEKSLSRTAAAVFVITQDDIRRSGMNSIPELLRTVPGLDTARMDANKWAITARGFNERFADKMQVLIDGRSVLTPLTSGVNWNLQDLMLEDIDRIEIILGPGATLWGANAVNGVINIITKSSKVTQGALVSAEASKESGGGGATRYGGSLGSSGTYRVYAKDTNTLPSTDASGAKADDSFRLVHGGMRADWAFSKHDEFTFWADTYRGSAGQTVDGIVSLSPPVMGTFDDRTAISGGNVQGQWHHTSSDRFDSTLQMYFTDSDLDQTGVLDYRYGTLDLDLVQHLAAGPRNDLIWGMDYRRDSDQSTGSDNISFDPANRATNQMGAFLQDEISLVPERVWLTVGTKLEYNTFSGLALEPNVRMLWAFRPRQSLWGAISHAAENSSRMDADVRSNGAAYAGPNGQTILESDFGTHVLPADKAIAYELGYRAQLNERFSFNAASYYNYYWNRHSHEPEPPYLEGDYLVVPTIVGSYISGETHGVELWATAKVSQDWKLTASYTLFQIHMQAAASSQDVVTASETEGTSPHHQFQIHSEFNVSRKVQFDTALYYVGRLPGEAIPQYTRIDARLGWRISPRVEVSCGAQNLLDPRHFEFASSDLVSTTQVGRNLYGRVTWRY